VHAGISNASAEFLRQRWHSRPDSPTSPWGHLIPALHRVTDAENWQTMRHTFYAASAAAILTLGHPVLAPPLASTTLATASAVHAVGRFSQRAICTSAAIMHRIARSSNVLQSPSLASAAVQFRRRWSLQPSALQVRLQGQQRLLAPTTGSMVAKQAHPLTRDVWRFVQPLLLNVRRHIFRSMRRHRLLRHAQGASVLGHFALRSMSKSIAWRTPQSA
jgi:hypothetical protein